MRLDLVLKSLCLVKQRSQAKKLCDEGRVLINGKTGKASRLVAEGDEFQIEFPTKKLTLRLIQLPATKNIPKAKASDYYELISQERIILDDDF